ncbi:MAG: LytTR family transcriptional regulator DNA-binding domain-containing protein [Lachnospiraceae bacterium]|nr:LytTR family transcriptional regulator DNA-binding domain-containing protein [Lachnospiraceae bacterium]
MNVIFETVDSKEQETAVIKAVEKTENIADAIKLLEGSRDRLQVISEGQTGFLSIKNIYYIESVDKRTFVYTKDNCYETKSRLYELEEDLGRFFLRCSKAMIVNIKKIKSVRSEMGSRLIATMLNDEEITISRNYVKEFKGRLEL